MSSSMIPVPSGKCSSPRIGNGFTMSKPRKSISPAKRHCQFRGTAMNATICPATSSITTCDGSSLPSARATRVAAGIPMRVAPTAAAMAISGREAGAANRAKPPQSNVVATEAHVPGPGRPKPAPKNVATAHAQSGAFTFAGLMDVAAVFVVVVAMAILVHFLHSLDVFGIGDGTGDYITSAGPFSQVNQAAALAAKREVRIVAQDKFPARRTA